MRFSVTNDHASKLAAHRDAYARFDAFAAKGDDGEEHGGSKEADAASDAERVTLRDFLGHASATTREVQQKIEIMRQRGPLHLDNLCWNEGDLTAWLDQIESDLIDMSRPNASPAMATAFAAWADAFEHYYALGDEDNDPELEKRGTEARRLRYVLLERPCTAAGDFIVKAFAEILDELGGEPNHPFLPQLEHTNRYDEQVWRDIRDSDLGCCMMVLGRTDFDAQLWLEAARRAGKKACVVVSEGKRNLQFIGPFEGDENSIGFMLQRLTATGLGQLSRKRCAAIADEIQANHPDLVIDTRVLEAV